MGNKPVVLVVEDEPLVKDSLVLELEDAGFEVVTAENGDEASYILPKMRRIDLLLTDIRMPGRINGWALADMARCRRPKLPVIYASGFSPQHGTEVEDSIFLPKPYRVSEILKAIEELQSGDEELSAISDELTAADFEASKEELQALNQELRKVNAKLKTRIAEMSRANSDIVSLLQGAQTATVFLDRNFAVIYFTPAAADLLDLTESDVGQPIARTDSRLRLDSIEEKAERALRTLGAVEAQVERDDGSKRYIMRILPYRALGNALAGVVVNFVDVTEVTAAAPEIGLSRELRDRVEHMEQILDLLPAGIFIASNDPTQHVQINRYGARLLGETDDQKGPRDAPVPYRLFADGRELAFWEQPLHRAVLTGQAAPPIKGRLVRRDGSSVDVLMSAEPLLDALGAPFGAVAVFIDLSARIGADTSADAPAPSERIGGLDGNSRNSPA
jgi:two-component system CheB/CheR fusion protein